MCYDLIKHPEDAFGLIQYDMRPENYNQNTGQDVCLGYCVFKKHNMTDWNSNYIDIIEVYINPAHYGKNLAEMLMMDVLEDAHCENYSYVTMSSSHTHYKVGDEDLAEILGIQTRGDIRRALFG